MPKSEKKWHVFVTTAPRKDCTLTTCIHHIRQAGWEPLIHAEPGSTQTDAKTVWNEYRKGLWCNWLSAAEYALQETDADIILSMQDDVRLHPLSRAYVEHAAWPTKSTGFISLYTPKHYSIKMRRLAPPGVIRVNTQSLWGACALAFPRKALQRLLRTPTVLNWLGAKPRSGDESIYDKRREDPTLIANSDTAIGKACNLLGLEMYFCNPSLSDHIAEHSTVGHGGNLGKRNAYKPLPHHMNPFDIIKFDYTPVEM